MINVPIVEELQEIDNLEDINFTVDDDDFNETRLFKSAERHRQITGLG